MRTMKNTLLYTTITLLTAATSASAVTTSYDVTFTGKWTTAASAPVARPGGAHFSPLIGATHNSSYNLFQTGTAASQGIEDMAEIGSRTALTNEINAAIPGGNVDSLIVPGGNIGAEASFTFRIEVDSDHSLFSLTSMIAPSPDWFVGVRNFDLRSGGSWINSATVDLNSYDAGTEDGNTFSLNNSATTGGTIQLLDTAEPTNPLFGNGSIASISFQQVPEPSSAALLGLGGLAMLTRRRKS